MIKRFAEWLYNKTHPPVLSAQKSINPELIKQLARLEFINTHPDEMAAVRENFNRRQKFKNIPNVSYCEAVEDTLVTLGLE